MSLLDDLDLVFALTNENPSVLHRAARSFKRARLVTDALVILAFVNLGALFGLLAGLASLR